MPKVSIVVATFNRADILHFTIAAAIRSTVTDWEMLVVGDACTDHTAQVVEAFGDPRIGFYNRSSNAGEQSIPNNDGVALTTGTYVAFLNHDDLWSPDHLAVALDHIERSGADLVATLSLGIDLAGEPYMIGAGAAGEMIAYPGVPASNWLVRRTAIATVGPWRSARSIWLIPSLDWLWRAQRAGLRLQSVPRATVLALQSGLRPGSYRDGTWLVEHATWFDRLVGDNRLFEKLLGRAAGYLHHQATGPLVWPHLRKAARKGYAKLALSCGFHPLVLRELLLFGRKGRLIDRLRKTRGLPPLQ